MENWYEIAVPHEDIRKGRFDEAVFAANLAEVAEGGTPRDRTGAIRFMANERKMARQFGEDYWLYIVTNAGTDDPNFTRRHNPAGTFREEEDIFATVFGISQDKWQEEDLRKATEPW